MIKCISYWSVAGGGDNSRPPEEAMDEAKGAGFAGIELAVGEKGILTPGTDEATCVRYREAAAARGLVLQTLASGMSWGCSPTAPEAATRRRSIELHRGALQRAAWLGAGAMLFVPGAVTIPWNPHYGPVKYDQAVAWAREAVMELGETAETLGVDLCLENVWNGLFYSPLELAAFVDQFKSSRVGVYFDLGNVLGYHQHPPHWIEILGPRIKRVHIKDFKASVGGLAGFCDLLAGDVPWRASMRALRAIGYDKTVVAEMMPPAPGLLERTSAAMDEIFAL
jgi:hexulose-6-phosphate isomerase